VCDASPRSSRSNHRSSGSGRVSAAKVKEKIISSLCAAWLTVRTLGEESPWYVYAVSSLHASLPKRYRGRAQKQKNPKRSQRHEKTESEACRCTRGLCHSKEKLEIPQISADFP
jgi:hypothetical protein